jgi:hypothetical protein
MPTDLFETVAYHYSVEQAIDEGYLLRSRELQHSFSLDSEGEQIVPVHNPLDVVTSVPISDDQIYKTYSIFISYRRDDSKHIVPQMFEELSKVFLFNDQSLVFMDQASINIGDDFEEKIFEAIETSTIVLAIIGRQWLNVRDNKGSHRLDDSSDYVRRELEFALEKQKAIVPVLVDKADMPHESALPESLRKLSKIQPFDFVHKEDYFEQEIQKLITILQDTLKKGARLND